MKRVLIFILLALSFALLLSGCKKPHSHSGGQATCTAKAVCDGCGVTYGEFGAHDFADATCLTPATCRVCSLTEGSAKGHTTSDVYESDSEKHWRVCTDCGAELDTEAHSGVASCTEDAHCSVCNAVHGVKLGHDFTAPNCQTPATCNRCGVTSGEVLHKYNDFFSHDETSHWIECSLCSARKDEGKHTGGTATLNDKAECEVCAAMYGDYLESPINWKTEAVMPTDGSSVYLANSKIREWYENFNYSLTDTNSYMSGDDIFIPDVPIIKWTVGSAAKYYKVYLATNPEMSSSECYLTNLTELSLDNLYVNTTYYWYVDAVYSEYTVRSEIFTFTTANTPRTVFIEGVSNSRDIGGYITVDGKRIKQGMVYRSAKLDDITELGKHTLVNILGVKTDLDLRGSRKTDGSGNVYSDPKDATHPVKELNHITVACPWYYSGENGIWYDDFNKEEFRDAIKVFADPDNYPIIFHCSLGRDRTGTLAIVLEGLLGLDENTIMMEYELSAFSYWGAYTANYNTSLRNYAHGTYTYINNNYQGDSFSEKVEDFLLEIGVTSEEIASIRSLLLEEVQ